MDEQHSLERKRKFKQHHDEVKLEITEERIAEGENPKKFCRICKKVFGNGKALGGHMRVHAQEPSSQRSINGGGFICSFISGEDSGKKIKPSYELHSSGTPVCHVCGKAFHSWKSLYGHMRCHPGRQWRGIPVPFDESGRDPVKIRVGADSGAINGPRRVVDLLRHIAGWPVTGKRGRGSSLPEAELDILEAAQNLLWLATGPRLWDGEGYFYKGERISECTAGKGSFCYEEIGVRIERESCFVLLDGCNSDQRKMGRPGNCVLMPKNGSGSELKSNVVNGFQVKVEEGNTVEKKKRGRKKKVKLETAEGKTKDPIINGSPDPRPSTRPVDPVVIPGPGGGFQCVTCSKEFSTYQALGGHRSKHYKERNGVESCFCHPGPDPENGSTGTDSSAEQGSPFSGGKVWAPLEAELVVDVNPPAECI